MRLTPEQISTVVQFTHQVMGANALVSVFGSRLDETRRGGDLDLLIEAEQRPTLLQRAELKTRLEAALQMPVDITGRQKGSPLRPFEAIAKATSRRLE